MSQDILQYLKWWSLVFFPQIFPKIIFSLCIQFHLKSVSKFCHHNFNWLKRCYFQCILNAGIIKVISPFYRYPIVSKHNNNTHDLLFTQMWTFLFDILFSPETYISIPFPSPHFFLLYHIFMLEILFLIVLLLCSKICT